jgi:hypothetical protein
MAQGLKLFLWAVLNLLAMAFSFHLLGYDHTKWTDEGLEQHEWAFWLFFIIFLVVPLAYFAWWATDYQIYLPIQGGMLPQYH